MNKQPSTAGAGISLSRPRLVNIAHVRTREYVDHLDPTEAVAARYTLVANERRLAMTEAV